MKNLLDKIPAKYKGIFFALCSALIGFLVFGQLPDGWSVLGYVIIIAMAGAMLIYNNR